MIHSLQDLYGILPSQKGGTGVNNGSFTITIGNNVQFVGAFTFSATLTSNTAVTFPVSGYLPSSAAALNSNRVLYSSLGSIAEVPAGSNGDVLTLAAGIPVWASSGSVIGIVPPNLGGTGIANNVASTLTISGAFASTFSVSGAFTYTFPTATSTLLANNLGISGGTTLVGGTAASQNLTLSSTSNATKGFIYFGGLLTSYWDENLDRLVLSSTTANPMSIASSFTGLSSVTYSQSISGTTSQLQFRVQNSSGNRMSLGMTSAGFTTGSGIVADMGFIDASGTGGLGIRSSGGGDIVNIITGTVYSRLTTTGLTLASGVLGLGTNATTNQPITSSFSLNGIVVSRFSNTSTGTAGVSQLGVQNSTGTLFISKYSTGYTTVGLLAASLGRLSGSTGDMLIDSQTASTNIIFAIGGTATTNEIARYTSTGFKNSLSVTWALASKSAAYNITTTDHNIEVTVAGSTQTLPTAVGVSGKEYQVINASAGVVRVNTTSSQTIGNAASGNPTFIDLAAGEVLKVISNNANWRII